VRADNRRLEAIGSPAPEIKRPDPVIDLLMTSLLIQRTR
jgi:hypothetical protein